MAREPCPVGEPQGLRAASRHPRGGEGRLSRPGTGQALQAERPLQRAGHLQDGGSRHGCRARAAGADGGDGARHQDGQGREFLSLRPLRQRQPLRQGPRRAALAHPREARGGDPARPERQTDLRAARSDREPSHVRREPALGALSRALPLQGLQGQPGRGAPPHRLRVEHEGSPPRAGPAHPARRHPARDDGHGHADHLHALRRPRRGSRAQHPDDPGDADQQWHGDPRRQRQPDAARRGSIHGRAAGDQRTGLFVPAERGTRPRAGRGGRSRRRSGGSRE